MNVAIQNHPGTLDITPGAGTCQDSADKLGTPVSSALSGRESNWDVTLFPDSPGACNMSWRSLGPPCPQSPSEVFPGWGQGHRAFWEDAQVSPKPQQSACLDEVPLPRCPLSPLITPPPSKVKGKEEKAIVVANCLSWQEKSHLQAPERAIHLQLPALAPASPCAGKV